MSQIGDLVWAKVRYSPHWPAIVDAAPFELKIPKNNVFVRFFGTGDYGIIDVKNIHDFHTYRTKYERKKKTTDMKRALQHIDEYSANQNLDEPIGKNRIEGEISLIQELGDVIKQERDLDVDPYDIIKVNVNAQDPRDREISTLKAEKAQLIVDLINFKTCNNDQFLKCQELEKRENIHNNEIRLLREQNKLYEKQTLEQRKIIDDLNSANKTLSLLVTDLQISIKNSNAEPLPLPNESMCLNEVPTEQQVDLPQTNPPQMNVELIRDNKVGNQKLDDQSSKKMAVKQKTVKEPKVPKVSKVPRVKNLKGKSKPVDKESKTLKSTIVNTPKKPKKSASNAKAKVDAFNDNNSQAQNLGEKKVPKDEKKAAKRKTKEESKEPKEKNGKDEPVVEKPKKQKVKRIKIK